MNDVWNLIRGDTMPSSSELYLVFDEIVYAAWYEMGTDFDGRWLNVETQEYIKPTHWMYLPDEPEE